MSTERIHGDYLPKFYSTGSGNRYSELIKLEKYSDEYQKYRRIMDGDFMEYFIAVYRVQNTFLENKYKLKLSEKKREFFSCFDVDERELLHCTSYNNVRSIIECNLNPRKARRMKFGRGVSFSPDAYYANLHSSGGKGIRAMFVCKVMIGDIEYGDLDAIPTYPCDTMMDRRGKVFVKNNAFEFYPTYVMFYKSYPVISERGRRSIVKPSSSNVCTLTRQTDEETVREAYIREYSKSLSNNICTRTRELTDNKSYAQKVSVTKFLKSANEILNKQAYGREPPNSDHAISSRVITYRQYNDQCYISTNRRDNYPNIFVSPDSEKKNSKLSTILKILFVSIFSVVVLQSLKSWEVQDKYIFPWQNRPEPTLLQQPYQYIIRLLQDKYIFPWQNRPEPTLLQQPYQYIIRLFSKSK